MRVGQNKMEKMWPFLSPASRGTHLLCEPAADALTLQPSTFLGAWGGQGQPY